MLTVFAKGRSLHSRLVLTAFAKGCSLHSRLGAHCVREGVLVILAIWCSLRSRRVLVTLAFGARSTCVWLVDENFALGFDGVAFSDGVEVGAGGEVIYGKL